MEGDDSSDEEIIELKSNEIERDLELLGVLVQSHDTSYIGIVNFLFFLLTF